MYHKLIILAIIFPLILGETSSKNFLFSPMEISDALPVQFWLEGCATYNQHIADGVHHKCFCAPWECDDNIKVQFKDTPSQNYSLLVVDEDEVILSEIDIEETSVGVYEINYVPSSASPEVCDQQIRLKIRKEAGVQGVVLPALNTWANDGGAGGPWATGAAPSVTVPAGGPQSEYLWVDYAFIVGVEYSVQINYTSSASTLSAQIEVVIFDGSFVAQFDNGIEVMPLGAASTTPIVFTATVDTTRIGVRITPDSFSSVTVTINSTEATRSLGSEEIVAKTDCLDIREDHPNTILLTYSNNRNFAGLVYENISPENEFQIRIPAIFFHQKFPEEDEVMELSSSLLTLNGTLRKQRLLDTDYAPYYFHEKLKLILKHQLLTIFSRLWVKQENYEIVEGDRKWPMKKAKVWLSERNFVHRNIL